MPDLDTTCHRAIAAGGFVTVTRLEDGYEVLVLAPEAGANPAAKPDVRLLVHCEFERAMLADAATFHVPGSVAAGHDQLTVTFQRCRP